MCMSLNLLHVKEARKRRTMTRIGWYCCIRRCVFVELGLGFTQIIRLTWILLAGLNWKRRMWLLRSEVCSGCNCDSFYWMFENSCDLFAEIGRFLCCFQILVNESVRIEHFPVVFSESHEFVWRLLFRHHYSDICAYVIEYSLNLTKGFLCDTSVLDWLLEDERV